MTLLRESSSLRGSQTLAGPGDGEPPIAQLLGLIRRRKWWVIQAVVIVLALVAFLTSRQTKEYTATASILFQSPPQTILNSGGISDPARQAGTNASLVVLPAVAERAAKSIDGVTAGEVQAAVTVTPANNSDVAEVVATTSSPDLSAVIATAYAKAYIQFRADIDRSSLREAITEVTRSIAALTPAERAGQAGQELRQQLDQLELARTLATANAKVVQEAQVPGGPSSPKPNRNLVLGLFLGLMLGVAAAFLRDRLDQSLRTPEELEDVYAVPILGRIPRMRRKQAEDALGLSAFQDGDHEAFRTLRANLRYIGPARELRSILIASPTSNDGKSTVASNLALTMAAMGDDVVLVDADLHRRDPGLGAHAHANGLSLVLSGVSTVEEALIEIPVASETGSAGARSLTLLPSGPLPPNPSELLESHRMTALLDELEDRYDRVVIDSPAFGAVSDTRALVARVSGILVVSSLSYTRRSAALDFRRQIDLLGGNVLGVVANMAPASTFADYRNYGS